MRDKQKGDAVGSQAFDIWCAQSLKVIEAALEQCIPAELAQTQSVVSDEPSARNVGDFEINVYTGNPLAQAMRYALLGPGKKIRPLLALASGYLVDAPLSALLPAACALECVHAYSLVHDDMPCMDDDDLRRGRATTHVVYGEATAMLVGDALQTLAFELLGKTKGIALEQSLTMVRRLANSAGCCGMVGGQMIDLSAVGVHLTQTDLSLMHAKKTGALLHCAVMFGYDCRSETQRFDPIVAQNLSAWAQILGLGFQVVDDIIDATSTTDQLGKTAGKDAIANKPTFVSMLGLSASQDYANDLYQKATALLVPLGSKAQYLQGLCEMVFKRDK